MYDIEKLSAARAVMKLYGASLKVAHKGLLLLLH